MRALVLGCGMQGRAAVHDLAASPGVEAITCADADLQRARTVLAQSGGGKTEAVELDAGDTRALSALIGSGYDVVVDMLPRHFIHSVGRAAIRHGVHLVNTYYDNDLRDLDGAARDAGIILLPEMGLDPGIDLIMAREAIGRFHSVTHLISYGGGIPAPGADDNPLRYRISWTWEGVLNAYARTARLIHQGQMVEVGAEAIFDEERVHSITVEDFGELEAYPNGDAAEYAARFGIVGTASEVGRYALRWPGHAAFWRVLAGLGFLEDEPVPGLGDLSPREFLVRHLEPRLQYSTHQRDAVILRVEARGDGDEGDQIVLELIDYRDLDTGLMAMNRTVGFPASIAAQMIASGVIEERGLLSPIHHVPWAPFVAELEGRGIRIRESGLP